MIEIGLFLTLLALGFIFGQRRENAHLLDLAKRESALLKMPIYQSIPMEREKYREAFLVTGSVVIASDYFKQVSSQIRSFFGGRLRAHESLMDRARREALIRMKEMASRQGASVVCDVSIQTAFLDQNGIEIFAFGTGLK